MALTGEIVNILMSHKTELDKVRDFMMVNDQTVRLTPVEHISQHEKMLRVGLLVEELWELADALGVDLGDKPTMYCKDSTVIKPVDTLDALTDILYVLFGTYHTCGLGKCAGPAFNEVHDSNMSKLGEDGKPYKDPDTGKIMKGPNYFKPNLALIVKAALRT